MITIIVGNKCNRDCMHCFLQKEYNKKTNLYEYPINFDPLDKNNINKYISIISSNKFRELLIKKHINSISLFSLGDIMMEDKDTLSIEKQNIISTFVSTLSSKIEVINIIVNSNSRLEPFSILISFYLLNIELDFLFNALLFSDDVMSQKYKNNGELSFYTTFLLSILSTCISNIISILFKKILSFIPVPLLIHKEQLDEVKPL